MRLVQHCRKLLSALNRQRELEPQLCDLTLKSADDVLVRCHKAVVSANSDYFNVMLTSSFIEACQSVVKVPINGRVLENVVDFFYEGSIHLEVETCLEYLAVADMVLAQDLIAECQRFVGGNLLQVLRCEETLRADPTSLAHILPVLRRQPKLNLRETLFSLHRWLSQDRKNRLTCFLELEMAVVDRLQADVEVKLLDWQGVESARGVVYVNFQRADQMFPNLLKFDGKRWSQCDWPREDDLPYNCEHFCIVQYGVSLLYCKSQGHSVMLRERGKPDRSVEDTSGSLMSFLKSEQHIFLHKITRHGDRLKLFDRSAKVFRPLHLPADYKLIKVCDGRIAENAASNEVFLFATVRAQDATLLEGVFCFRLDPQRPWIVENVSLLPYKSCERDIPAVYCGHSVILSTRERRAFVHEQSPAGQWREKLSFPLVELDSSNFEIIYIYSSRGRLYLVVAQDQEIRITCYDELCASGRDVTLSTGFPRARLDPERGVLFRPEED